MSEESYKCHDPAHIASLREKKMTLLKHFINKTLLVGKPLHLYHLQVSHMKLIFSMTNRSQG